PYAVHVLGLSASAIGTSLAAYGVGMLVGALLAARLMRSLSIGMAIAMGPLVSVAAAAVMVATLWHPSPLLMGASFFLFGAGPILWTISQTTLRQTVTPDALLGRVSALFMTASAGARPMGAAAGPEAAILLAALGFMVQALVIIWSPVPRLARLPDRAERLTAA